MTNAILPSSLRTGCRPLPRPMMLSRRIARPMLPSLNNPSSSGPRWTKTSFIGAKTSRGTSRSPNANIPAMPHMLSTHAREGQLDLQKGLIILADADPAQPKQILPGSIRTPLGRTSVPVSRPANHGDLLFGEVAPFPVWEGEANDRRSQLGLNTFLRYAHLSIGVG